LLVLSPMYRSADSDRGRVARVALTVLQLADGMARFARETLEAKRPFVVLSAGEGRSGGLGDRFAARLTAGDAEAELAGIAFINEDYKWADLAADLVEAGPDVIFADVPAADLPALASAARGKKIFAPIVNVLHHWEVEELTRADAPLLGPAYFAVEFFDDGGKQLAPLRKSPDGKQRVSPDRTAAVAFDAVLLLHQAARRADADGDKLIDAWPGVRDVDGVLGRAGFDARGRLVRPLAIVKAEPGKDAKGVKLTLVRRMLPAVPVAKTRPKDKADAPEQGKER
jgi:ABC-type branched-subunit amino acid transport system substrate-binding protein